jgi:RNA polymerase primary sigma factor
MDLRLVSLREKTEKMSSFSDQTFDDPVKIKAILAPMPDLKSHELTREKLAQGIEQISRELRPYYQEPLLTREQELHLFKQMNYFKYVVLKALNKGKIREKDILFVEDCLFKAQAISQKIVCCNLRLVMSMAKKQKEFHNQPNMLFDILSDGYTGLVRSVELFDWRYGTKFSTYATISILRTFAQNSKKRTNYLQKVHTGFDEGFFIDLEEKRSSQERERDEKLDETVRVLSLLDKLPPRQKIAIVQGYFEKKRLIDIGKVLKVSKERVRQIRNKGISKLRQLMEECDH